MDYTDALLDSMRHEADPVPDRLIEGIYQRSEVGAVNAVLTHLIRNDQPIPAELPGDLADWLESSGKVPDGTDFARINRASRIFAEHGLLISVALTASLVRLYACSKGVKVLASTYRLDQDAYRRIGETAQFVILVLAPGGLSPTGGGIPAIQKVRLMHAAIRCLVNHSGRWRPSEWGLPICQEDLLGTLTSFSYTVVRDLEKFGITLSAREADDYIYIWRVIGQLLGVRPDLIPIDMVQAQAAATRVFGRNQAPSAEGVQMTRALLTMYARLTPGRRLDGSFSALLRHLVGNEVADWMQIPRSSWDVGMQNLSWFGRIIDWFRPRSKRMGAMARTLGLELMSRQAIALSGYRRAAFTIPTELRQSWGLPEPHK